MTLLTFVPFVIRLEEWGRDYILKCNGFHMWRRVVGWSISWWPRWTILAKCTTWGPSVKWLKALVRLQSSNADTSRKLRKTRTSRVVFACSYSLSNIMQFCWPQVLVKELCSRIVFSVAFLSVLLLLCWVLPPCSFFFSPLYCLSWSSHGTCSALKPQESCRWINFFSKQYSRCICFCIILMLVCVFLVNRYSSHIREWAQLFFVKDEHNIMNCWCHLAFEFHSWCTFPVKPVSNI